MTLSVWFNMDSLQVDGYVQIVSAKKDSVGFALQQRGAINALNLRLDAEHGVYNSVYGRADGVLDNQQHNYTFKINGDAVTMFVDGVLNSKDEFDSGDGFGKAVNPGVGYKGTRGGIDEVFFLDGTQSDNWMRLFYALQAANR